tara:strand:- start:3279 stop:4550 length:1272 start_codon:yes stop_codon:yes gene_type:complete
MKYFKKTANMAKVKKFMDKGMSKAEAMKAAYPNTKTANVPAALYAGNSANKAIQDSGLIGDTPGDTIKNVGNAYGEFVGDNVDSAIDYASGNQGYIPDIYTGNVPTKQAITDAVTGAGDYITDTASNVGNYISDKADDVSSYLSGNQGLIPDAITGGTPTMEFVQGGIDKLKNYWGAGNDSYDSPAEIAGAGDVIDTAVPQAQPMTDTTALSDTTADTLVPTDTQQINTHTPTVDTNTLIDTNTPVETNTIVNPDAVNSTPSPMADGAGKLKKKSSLKFFSKVATDTEFKQDDRKLTTNVVVGGPGGGQGVRLNYGVGADTPEGLYGNLGTNFTATTGYDKPYFSGDLEAQLGHTFDIGKFKDFKGFGGLNLGYGTEGGYTGGHIGIGKDFKTTGDGVISPFLRYNMGDKNFKGLEGGVSFKF